MSPVRAEDAHRIGDADQPSMMLCSILSLTGLATYLSPAAPCVPSLARRAFMAHRSQSAASTSRGLSTTASWGPATARSALSPVPHRAPSDYPPSHGHAQCRAAPCAGRGLVSTLRPIHVGYAASWFVSRLQECLMYISMLSSLTMRQLPVCCDG